MGNKFGHNYCEGIDEGSNKVFEIIKEIGQERSYIGCAGRRGYLRRHCDSVALRYSWMMFRG
jgi:hypothetical protein